MNKADKASTSFKYSLNCAQAVVSVFGDELKQAEQTASNTLPGLTAVIREKDGMCGALKGAIAVIRLKAQTYPQGDPRGSEETTNDRIDRLIKRFKERNGSVTCGELTGCDISKDEVFMEALAKGLFSTICCPLVRDAVEITEELITDQPL